MEGNPFVLHRTKEGKLYRCAIKDVLSNRIVGYSIDERMKSRIALKPRVAIPREEAAARAEPPIASEETPRQGRRRA